MKIGNKNPQSNIDYDTLEKIFEHTITTADTNAKLLCLFEGADAATTGTADTGQTITFAGTAQIDTAQYKIGTSSLLLDGNSDYVTVPDSADWDFGTGDFTIDFWVRYTGTLNSYAPVYNQTTDASNYTRIDFGDDADLGKLRMSHVVAGSATLYLVSSTALVVDTWTHVAVVRNGDNFKIYYDGVQVATTDSTGYAMASHTSVLTIGNALTRYFNGHIDAFRVTKGTALWTADFTPPTTSNDYVTATSISIFGLDGDTDEQYMLDCRFVNGYNGGNNFYLLANNDSGTNYGTQNLVGSVTTVSANRSARTNFDIGYCSTVDYICQSNLVLHAKSGYVRTCLINIGRSITGTAVADIIVTGSSWNNTADEITSLIIQSLNANGLGIGSSISLYRRITA